MGPAQTPPGRTTIFKDRGEFCVLSASPVTGKGGPQILQEEPVQRAEDRKEKRGNKHKKRPREMQQWVGWEEY